MPAAQSGTKGAWLARRRLTAIDGSSLEVADTDANVGYFGRMGSTRRPFPPEHLAEAIPEAVTEILRHQLPERWHRTCARAVERARHNSYRVKRTAVRIIRHDRPPHTSSGLSKDPSDRDLVARRRNAHNWLGSAPVLVTVAIWSGS